MAIKGKKKAGVRGGARRPAGAPRPRVAARGEHVPWYQTSGGRVFAAIIAVVIVATIGGVAAAMVSSNRAEDERREKAQNALEGYTGQVKAVLQQIADPASAMSIVQPPQNDNQVDRLSEQATEWSQQFSSALSIELEPPASVANLNNLFFQAVRSYDLAADTYKSAARADTEKLRIDIMRKAQSMGNQGTSIWGVALALLDDARDDAGMDPADVGLPTAGVTAPGG
jgi:hypothetical protein